MRTDPQISEPFRLQRVLFDAADGLFPDPDGDFTAVGPDPISGQYAIVEFTGHAVIASTLRRDELAALGADGFGGAGRPELVRAVAGPEAWIDVQDAVLVHPGSGIGAHDTSPTDALADHPRVRYGSAFRHEVTVYANDHGLLLHGRGLCDRWEVGFEVFEGQRGGGHAAPLLADAVAVTPAGEPLFASCAPGNARSLRALLRAGFVPIGSERLIRPATVEPDGDQSRRG